MVIKQPYGRLGVLIQDAAKKDVLVVIDPNADLDRKPASLVITTHAKDTPNAVLSAIRDGHVVYRDESRSEEWLRKAQRQLPGTAAIPGFAANIATRADLVKRLGALYQERGDLNQGALGKIRLNPTGQPGRDFLGAEGVRPPIPSKATFRFSNAA